MAVKSGHENQFEMTRKEPQVLLLCRSGCEAFVLETVHSNCGISNDRIVILSDFQRCRVQRCWGSLFTAESCTRYVQAPAHTTRHIVNQP